MQSKHLVMVSRAGCFLPFLLVFNLFLGWLFFKPLSWLLIELVLILLFVISSVVVTKSAASSYRKKGDVIDVKAEVVKDKKRIA